MQLHISSEHVSLLRQRGGLGVLAPSECSALLRQARARTLPSGVPLFVQGAPSDEVAWILQGQAQLIVHGRNRTECLMRLRRALDEFVVDGIETTLPLFRTLVRNPDMQNGDYDIHWLEAFLATGGMADPSGV